MVPQWLHPLAVFWLAAAGLSAVAVIVDIVRHPQKMAIMNAVWPITALYFGPLVFWPYVALARNDGRERQPAFWHKIVIEATHCGAGCTLGDVIAEFAIFFLGLQIAGSALLTSYAGDFTLAYAFGIVFQYFAIAPMRGLSLWPGIVAAIQADTISLIAFEIGLFAFMFFMQHLPFRAQLTPLTPEYWFLMQLGMLVGYATSYPANWFLVRVGIKEPM